MHLQLAIALASARRYTCPCGACADEAYGYCRKCRARITWRRHHRHPSRRRTGRLARRVVRAFSPPASTRPPNTRPADAQPSTPEPETPASAPQAHPPHDGASHPALAAVPGGESDV
jgi:hypothetical protein